MFIPVSECSLVEESESHVIIFLLGLRLRSLGCSSKLARISKELLQHLSLLEGDVGHSSNSQQVLHAIDHAVGDRGNGGVGDSQGQSGYLSNSGHELGLQIIISNVKDLRVEH